MKVGERYDPVESLMAEAFDDGYKEGFADGYNAKSLELSKYAWHDLRKNPDDLPKHDGMYRCCFIENHKEVYLELEFKAEFGFGVTTWTEHNELLGCPHEYYFEILDENEIVVGWQEIEQFEVTE